MIVQLTVLMTLLVFETSVRHPYERLATINYTRFKCKTFFKNVQPLTHDDRYERLVKLEHISRFPIS